MKAVTRPRVVTPADIAVDRTKVVNKEDRGIILGERGYNKNKTYDIVFTSTAEAAAGYPLYLEGVPASWVILV